MKRQELIGRISTLSTEAIVELRHHAQLSDNDYVALMDLLHEYRDMLEGESMIEREATGSLHYLNIAFNSALEHLQRVDQKRFSRLRAQYDDFRMLMSEILDPSTQNLEKEWRQRND